MHNANNTFLVEVLVKPQSNIKPWKQFEATENFIMKKVSKLNTNKTEQAISGSRCDIKPPIPDDVIAINTNRGLLYQVCTDTGDLVLTKVGTSPFQQEWLDSGDCFIIDSGSNNTIFVWKGFQFSLIVN